MSISGTYNEKCHQLLIIAQGKPDEKKRPENVSNTIKNISSPSKINQIFNRNLQTLLGSVETRNVSELMCNPSSGIKLIYNSLNV